MRRDDREACGHGDGSPRHRLGRGCPPAAPARSSRIAAEDPQGKRASQNRDESHEQKPDDVDPRIEPARERVARELRRSGARGKRDGCQNGNSESGGGSDRRDGSIPARLLGVQGEVG
jgi:hypothetical protein